MEICGDGSMGLGKVEKKIGKRTQIGRRRLTLQRCRACSALASEETQTQGKLPEL